MTSVRAREGCRLLIGWLAAAAEPDAINKAVPASKYLRMIKIFQFLASRTTKQDALHIRPVFDTPMIEKYIQAIHAKSGLANRCPFVKYIDKNACNEHEGNVLSGCFQAGLPVLMATKQRQAVVHLQTAAVRR